MAPLLFATLLASALWNSGPADGQPGLDSLSSADKQAISEAAKNALEARGLWNSKTYLTNTELVWDQSVNPPTRYALLNFYRYEGNLAILATVGLEKMAVTNIETHPHMPTSLAPPEIAEANKIARAHPEVQKALAKYKHLDKIEADTAVAYIINPSAPGFQHRVARLFFRDENRNYLQFLPMVDVDLTTGEVRFEPVRGPHR